MRSKRILITGAGGMLGSDLALHLSNGFDVLGVGKHAAPHLNIPYEDCDLTVPESVEKVVEGFGPQIIFHTAALTDVDRCEVEQDLAHRSNVVVTQYVVKAAEKIGALIIFFSTDYVFDGAQKEECREDDQPNPVNFYGRTKLWAENLIRENSNSYIIFRLSWLFGLRGRSFLGTLFEKNENRLPFKVVMDQIGRPSLTWDIAEAFAKKLKTDYASFSEKKGNIYHMANQGQASWFEVAQYAIEKLGKKDVTIIPITSHKLGRVAKRPANSVLSLEKLRDDLGMSLRPWKEAVDYFVENYRRSKGVQVKNG